MPDTVPVVRRLTPAVRRTLAFLCLAGAAACARSTQAGLPAKTRPESFTGASKRMTVGTDELLQQRSIDLGRTLERVRPEFLRSRAPSPRFPNGAHADVYLDGTFLGGLEMLRLIRTSEVLEVRYMTPVEATVWFGREHPGGTLLVRTHWAPRF